MINCVTVSFGEVSLLGLQSFRRHFPKEQQQRLSFFMKGDTEKKIITDEEEASSHGFACDDCLYIGVRGSRVHFDDW